MNEWGNSFPEGKKESLFKLLFVPHTACPWTLSHQLFVYNIISKNNLCVWKTSSWVIPQLRNEFVESIPWTIFHSKHLILSRPLHFQTHTNNLRALMEEYVFMLPIKIKIKIYILIFNQHFEFPVNVNEYSVMFEEHGIHYSEGQHSNQ